MRNVHRKCTTAKNKSRGFWGFLKVDHRNRTVSEIVDPVNKSLILDDKCQIEDALQHYFSNIGNHANNMQDVDNFKDNVRKRVAKLDENLVPTTDMFSDTVRFLWSPLRKPQKPLLLLFAVVHFL
jgi:hypothetical protein